LSLCHSVTLSLIMHEDEMMFHWGIGMAVAAVAVSVALQVGFRTQDKSRAHIKAEIVRTQQEIADNSAKFSALTRPEVLRSVVIEMYPKYEPLGFGKTINAKDIIIR